MSGVIKSVFAPKAQTPAAPPPAPTVDQAVIDQQAANVARRRRGAAATQLAGNTGAATVSTPVLGG